MLLTSFTRHKDVCAHSYKHVLEICMDRMGLYNKVAIEKPKFLNNSYSGVRIDGFKDVHMTFIVDEMYKTKQIDPHEVPIPAMLAFIKTRMGFTDKEICDLRLSFMDYVVSHNQDELIKQYANTRMVREQIINMLGNFSAVGADKAKLRGDEVVALYRKFLLTGNNETNFARDSESVISFVTQNYKFFAAKNSQTIMSIMNKKDFKLVGGGENGDDFDYSNEMPLEVDSVTKLENFSQIAYNILTASSILYQHVEETFYDLWSRYKKKILNERYSNMIRELKKRNSALSFTGVIVVRDKNYSPGVNVRYRKGILNSREDLLEIFEKEFENGLPTYRYESVFNDMISRDTRHQAKNSRRLFNIGDDTVMRGSKFGNSEIFFKILQGFSSVSALAEYCREADIDPLTVPSKIFRDPKYYMRVPSFEDYIGTCNITTKLMQEANTSKQSEELSNSLETNDNMLQRAIGMKRDNDLRSLSVLLFKDIKDILFNGKPFGESEVDLNRVSDFKSEGFRKRALAISKLSQGNLNNFKNMLFLLKYLEDNNHIEICKSYEVTDNSGKIIRIPLMWKNLNPTLLSKLNNIQHPSLEGILAEYGKINKQGNDQFFYNCIRFANLNFNISFRLFLLYKELSSETLTPVRIFTILDAHRGLLDLPDKITSLSQINSLIENKMDNLSNLNKIKMYMNITLCQPTSMSDASVFQHYKYVYQTVMRKYKVFFDYIRKIRDELYSDLNISGIVAKSPFGIYHNTVLNMSNKLIVGYIASVTATKNSQFLTIRANCDKETSVHHFLVQRGKAAYVLKNEYKYFVHESGVLYCPQLNDAINTADIKETDKIYFD